MRKALIIALGLASLGAIASVQQAVALDMDCTLVASSSRADYTCTATSNGQVCVRNEHYGIVYNRCVANKAAKAAAAGQSGALTTAKPGPDIQQGKKTHAN